MMRPVFLACALAFLITGHPANGQARSSRYTGKDLERRLEKYRGVTVEMWPETTSYMQGQSIYLHYRIRADSPRVCPWGSWDLSRQLTLLRDGVATRHMWVLLIDVPLRGPAQTVFEGFFTLDRDFWNSDSLDTCAFHYLIPGAYTGYFDNGIVSPDFTFEVTAMPDSLQPRWERFRLLTCLQKQMNSHRPLALLDTTLQLMREFMALPVGSLWRKEALDRGVFTFNLERNHYELRPADAALLRKALATLADEPGYPPVFVAGGAAETVCKRSTREQTAKALLKFARRLGKPDVTREAGQLAKRLKASVKK